MIFEIITGIAVAVVKETSILTFWYLSFSIIIGIGDILGIYTELILPCIAAFIIETILAAATGACSLPVIMLIICVLGSGGKQK